MSCGGFRVLVTGAAGGIGSRVAARLAAAGATLLLTDVRAEALEPVAAELGRRGVRLDAAAADVTTGEGRRALAARARDLEIDTLINVAGVNPFGLVAEQTAAEVEKTLAINTLAPMLLCQVLVPVLAQRAEAHIVNVGSTFGSIGYPGFCAYSASKFALRGFSEALRRELADTPIRVHYVAPRATRTALASGRIHALNEELKVAMDPPEAVARAVERALRRGRRETYLGMPERLFVKINALLPAVVDYALGRQLAVIRRHAARAADVSDRNAAPLP